MASFRKFSMTGRVAITLAMVAILPLAYAVSSLFSVSPDGDAIAAATSAAAAAGVALVLVLFVAVWEKPDRTRATIPDDNLSSAFSGRYELHGLLGLGGMGAVYRGWDAKLRRHVALKTVRFDGLEPEDAAARARSLVAEAIAVAGLSHPNVVAVYDVEDSTQAACIAMELIDGVSLQTFLEARQKLSPSETVLIGAAVARALEAAHLRGIPHYDVKPANVLLGFDGAIKVADFGIAPMIAITAATHEMVFGTAGYIAPEAARGEHRDEKCDLFGLGVMLYECATGSHPFNRKTARETIIASLQETPPPLASVLEPNNVLPALSAIVEELMQKSPADRPATAGEVASRLERVIRKHGLSWRGELVEPEMRPATIAPTLALLAS